MPRSFLRGALLALLMPALVLSAPAYAQVSGQPSTTGAATAAGQASALTVNQAIRDRIGETQATPTANTVADRLKTLHADIAALQAQVGEVQALPTANTMLDRLKTVHADLVTISGYVDGLEALAATTNANLTSIDGHVDQLEGYVDQIEGYVDGIEGLITASNVSLASIDGKLSNQATGAKQDAAQTSLSSIDAGLGGAAAAVAGSTGASTNNGFLRFLRDVFTTPPATAAKQDTGNTSLGSIDTKLTSQATAALQTTGNTSAAATATALGAPADTVCASDTGTCALIALVKRLNQLLTTINSSTADVPVVNGSVGPLAVQNASSGTLGSAPPGSASYTAANSSGLLTGVIQADASVKIDTAASGILQLIPLTSGQNIYVTGWDVMAGGTGTYKLVYGTGTNCGTGTTDVTGPYPLIAQNGLARGGALGVVYKIPAGNALCGNNGSAVQQSGSVSYTKF